MSFFCLSVYWRNSVTHANVRFTRHSLKALTHYAALKNLLLVDFPNVQHLMTSDSWHVWSSQLSICRLWLRCNQTCSIQFISEPRTCTKFITEQNQTLLIAILQTWYVLGNNPCSECQEESLDKWPNFRCKNPPVGLLSQHEGRRKDSSRHTQFVLPHISWEVFWHTFQRNKVIKGEEHVTLLS